MTELEELRMLIQSSQTLSEEDRQRFLVELGQFTPEEVGELLGIFRFEQKGLLKAQKRLQEHSATLENEFRVMVTEFKMKKIPEVLRAVESDQRQKDDQSADSLLQNLDNTQQ